MKTSHLVSGITAVALSLSIAAHTKIDSHKPVKSTELPLPYEPIELPSMGPVNTSALARQFVAEKYERKDREKSDLEKEIQATWNLTIKGQPNPQSLVNMKQALKEMPVVPHCNVYFIPRNKETMTIFGTHISGVTDADKGWAIGPKNIFLMLKGSGLVDNETVTHEFTHLYHTTLGDSFNQSWDKTNEVPYGKDLVVVKGNYVWTDGSTKIRNGFMNPYASQNRQEDVAMTVERVRHGKELYLSKFMLDEISRRVLLEKVDLAEKNKLLSPKEKTWAKNCLDTVYIKSQLYFLEHVFIRLSGQEKGEYKIDESGGIELWVNPQKRTVIILDRSHEDNRNGLPPSRNYTSPRMVVQFGEVRKDYQQFLPEGFIKKVAEIK